MTARERWTIGCAALVVALGSASLALAATDPEQKCLADRAKAAGKYADCAQKAVAKWNLTSDWDGYAVADGKCLRKYAATWPKLQAKASGSATCDQARFEDNGDGTVTDWLTGLQWQQVTDAAHNYTWSEGGAEFTAADGTAFTSFLSSLNAGGCLAGQCDWRLPTRDELLTIVTPAYPACTSTPCIDPVFGPTRRDDYWSATTFARVPDRAWTVDFAGGFVDERPKSSTYSSRAVRSGL